MLPYMCPAAEEMSPAVGVHLLSPEVETHNNKRRRKERFGERPVRRTTVNGALFKGEARRGIVKSSN